MYCRYPILAIQYHPEKNLFEWSSQRNYAHTFYGYSASQYTGDYFVQSTRQSCQSFQSEEELKPYLIFNYNASYTQSQFTNLHFTQMYIFDN